MSDVFSRNRMICVNYIYEHESFTVDELQAAIRQQNGDEYPAIDGVQTIGDYLEDLVAMDVLKKSDGRYSVVRRESRADKLLASWLALTDEQRDTLVPRLLLNTRGWKAWATDPAGCIMWLRTTFEKAGVPFLG